MKYVRITRPQIGAVATVAAILALAAVLQFTNVNPAASQSATLNAPQVGDDPGLDPDSAVWEDAPALDVPLSGQLGLYSAGGGSVTSLTARAVNYEGSVYVRVEWADPTQDDSTTRVDDFADGIALEFPATAAVSVPSVCMGQADSGVNIWHWRADSEATEHDPDVVYPNAMVDAYPSKDDLWYTARAAGNPYAQVDTGPVQTLVAQAFGTLSAAEVQDVEGHGRYADGKWAVVLKRQFAGANNDQATFSESGATDMAFAIWNGSEGDRNGQKSVSPFVTLKLSAVVLAGGDEDHTAIVLTAVGLLVGLTALGIGLAWYGYRQAQGERA
jgi:complex iron-sulfur molybdoenzyme family reductase subunit gamma